MKNLNLTRKLILPCIVLFALQVFVTSCKSVERVPKEVASKEEIEVMILTDSGLQFRIVKEGHGENAKDGDMVSVHYTGIFEDGEVFDSSFQREKPIQFKLGEGMVIKGWEEGLKLLNKGALATLRIPSNLAYGEAGMGPIPPEATLVFDIELVDIIKPPKPADVSETSLKQTNSGLQYAVFLPGTGKKLEAGMNVKVHYSGFFENGGLFDSSYERGNPIEFVLGKGMVIPGWEEGLQLLRVGDKARLNIPYHLAYGESGRGPIPGKTNLVFDVEVVDAIKVPVPEPFDVHGKPRHSTDEGLEYVIVEQGIGTKPQPGDLLVVHYTGYLIDGTMFDSSVQRGETFSFRLGQGNVIAGWDQGFAFLQKGTKARLIIPAKLAYGDRQVGSIPAGSALVFDVQLIDIQP